MRTRVATAIAMVASAVVMGFVTDPASAAPEPVAPSVETDPVTHSGDAMDDPAIWVHPSDPSRSLVLGNDKGGALETYDLDGGLVQRITDGVSFWGNVDVRQGVTVGGTTRDVVAVSHRAIQFYTVDPSTRQLSSITDGTAVGALGEGLCMYHSAQSGKLYVINITRPGRLRQWEVRDTDGDGLLQVSLVRDFQVGSEAEGCVADDETGALFVSQEDVALWRYDAEPTGGTTRTVVDRVTGSGGHLAPDIEGVTLVDRGAGDGYLIVSAQNGADANNSYFVVYDRRPPHDFVSEFRVVDGTVADDCDRTDGVAAYAGDLGPAFPQGLFVCQDNNNNPPGTSGNQNLKLVRLERAVDLGAAPPNQPPVAAVTTSCLQLACTLDGSGSDDPDGQVVDHAWSFGDGSPVAHGPVQQHTYAAAGTYQVTLTVTDDDGATDSATASVTVTDTAAPITFVAQRSSPNTNATSWSTTVPATVQAGDGMLAIYSGGGATPTLVTSGWQLVARSVDDDHGTSVWRRVATAGDPGSTVQVTAPSLHKGVLTVAAWRGTDAGNPLATYGTAIKSGTSTQFTTPTVSDPADGGWRVSYWSVKSSTITSLTPPGGETTRFTSNSTGSGRVTTLLTDSGGPVATGTQGGLTATSDAAAAKATVWTFILRPAS